MCKVYTRKIWLTMRLAFFILLATSIKVSAVSFVQIIENAAPYQLDFLNKNNIQITGFLLVANIFLLLSVFVLWQNRKYLKLQNIQAVSRNADMQRALNELEQSREENTRMLKIVAHDLRGPMAATISIAAMLLENGDLLPEDREMLEMIRTSSLHSLEMIADLLNMNTTAEGLKKEPVEMHTLLHYCVNLLKFKATEKKQEILLHTEDLVIHINREKIWRVISNLLVNAIKFSNEGSRINVRMHMGLNSVKISIQDQGIGIPDSLKDKVFNMFTDARRSGTAGEHSFGLGLAISRQIVEAHEGNIWFESNAGEGTTFYVELPIV